MPIYTGTYYNAIQNKYSQTIFSRNSLLPQPSIYWVVNAMTKYEKNLELVSVQTYNVDFVFYISSRPYTDYTSNCLCSYIYDGNVIGTSFIFGTDLNRVREYIEDYIGGTPTSIQQFTGNYGGDFAFT